MPPFQFFLAADAVTPVKRGDAVWRSHLPSGRNPQAAPAASAVTYGDYFDAIREFLQTRRYQNLLAPVKALSINHATPKRPPGPEEIRAVRVIQEKHGAFYHPARLEIDFKAQCIRAALNVAVSVAGLNSINQEYKLLRRLNQTYPLHFIPRAYCLGETALSNGKQRIGVMMAEWLDGYHEFHLSRADTGGLGLVVWDPQRGAWFLSDNQAMALYTQAAEILTYYYNIDTFEQVFPWHHAAGDFVLKWEQHKLALKLITVRQYAAMLAIDDESRPTKAMQWQALLLFLLNLSMRMRLDRLDGVGAIGWADDPAVNGVIKGFFRGLALQAAAHQITQVFINQFRHYLAAQAISELHEACDALISAYHPQAPDIPVIRSHLDRHVSRLHRAIASHCQGRR